MKNAPEKTCKNELLSQKLFNVQIDCDKLELTILWSTFLGILLLPSDLKK